MDPVKTKGPSTSKKKHYSCGNNSKLGRLKSQNSIEQRKPKAFHISPYFLCPWAAPWNDWLSISTIDLGHGMAGTVGYVQLWRILAGRVVSNIGSVDKSRLPRKKRFWRNCPWYHLKSCTINDGWTFFLIHLMWCLILFDDMIMLKFIGFRR